jgi:hypothetical protein
LSFDGFRFDLAVCTCQAHSHRAHANSHLQFSTLNSRSRHPQIASGVVIAAPVKSPQSWRIRQRGGGRALHSINRQFECVTLTSAYQMWRENRYGWGGLSLGDPDD